MSETITTVIAWTFTIVSMVGMLRFAEWALFRETEELDAIDNEWPVASHKRHRRV